MTDAQNIRSYVRPKHFNKLLRLPGISGILVCGPSYKYSIHTHTHKNEYSVKNRRNILLTNLGDELVPTTIPCECEKGQYKIRVRTRRTSAVPRHGGHKTNNDGTFTHYWRPPSGRSGSPAVQFSASAAVPSTNSACS